MLPIEASQFLRLCRGQQFLLGHHDRILLDSPLCKLRRDSRDLGHGFGGRCWTMLVGHS
jgi:hypothetical protein